MGRTSSSSLQLSWHVMPAWTGYATSRESLARPSHPSAPPTDRTAAVERPDAGAVAMVGCGGGKRRLRRASHAHGVRARRVASHGEAKSRSLLEPRRFRVAARSRGPRGGSACDRCGLVLDGGRARARLAMGEHGERSSPRPRRRRKSEPSSPRPHGGNGSARAGRSTWVCRRSSRAPCVGGVRPKTTEGNLAPLRVTGAVVGFLRGRLIGPRFRHRSIVELQLCVHSQIR